MAPPRICSARTPVLELRVKSVWVIERGGLLGVMPAGEVGGDDRARAGSGQLDPFPYVALRVARAIGELLQRSGERDPLDPAALEHAVCLVEVMVTSVSFYRASRAPAGSRQ